MIPIPFAELALPLNLLLFALAAGVIWLAGVRLAVYADAIADRKRIGKAIMGLVFLAAATELPELVTTITAAMGGNAELVLNNMFGGITMQTAILAVADVVAVHATLTFFPRKTTLAVEGGLLIFLLALLLAIISIGDLPVFGRIGAGSLTLGIAYLAVIHFLREHDSNSGWRPIDVAEEQGPVFGGTKRASLEQVPMQQLYGLTAIAVAAILFAGLALVQLAEALAEQTGLGSSFIGATLLAASTSLPELSTTVSAVRIGAYTMAISNIFGSNLIMVALLLPADIFYTGGRLLEHADKTARFALISGILVTAVYVVGLLVRSRKRVFGMGYDSLVVVIIYLLTILVFYRFSSP